MMEAMTTQFCDAIQNKLGRVKNATSIFVVDSDIIPEAKQDELEDILKLKASGIHELKKMLYRGTKNGMTPKAFHDKCDGQGPTLTLVRTSKDYVFGGYAGSSWNSASGCVTDPSCFVFNVVNPYNDPVTKMPVLKPERAMYCGVAYGPHFPGAFALYNRDLNSEGPLDSCWAGVFHAVYGPYGDPLGRGYSTFVDDSEDGDFFTAVEIEVFAVAVPLC